MMCLHLYRVKKDQEQWPTHKAFNTGHQPRLSFCSLSEGIRCYFNNWQYC